MSVYSSCFIVYYSQCTVYHLQCKLFRLPKGEGSHRQKRGRQVVKKEGAVFNKELKEEAVFHKELRREQVCRVISRLYKLLQNGTGPYRDCLLSDLI